MIKHTNYRGRKTRGRVKKWPAALLVLLGLGLVLFGALEILIAMGSRGQTAQADGGAAVMVIFGCQVKPDGPSALLKDRLDTALAYLEDHPETRVVVTGGKGDDEHMSEAQCMYDYLTEHGVGRNTILMEDKSRNTRQNIQNSLGLLWNGPGPWDAILPKENCRYVLVSSDFHLTRILMLWARATGRTDNVTALPAPCSHFPSRAQMFFREPLALVKSFLFDREFQLSW